MWNFGINFSFACFTSVLKTWFLTFCSANITFHCIIHERFCIYSYSFFSPFFLLSYVFLVNTLHFFQKFQFLKVARDLLAPLESSNSIQTQFKHQMSTGTLLKGTGTRDLIWLKVASLERSWVGLTEDLYKFLRCCFIFLINILKS